MPLALIHGWGCDSRIWYAVLDGLRQERAVITVDLPGFFADDGSDTSSPCDLETLLVGLAHQLPNRVTLLGWSLGGMVATAFAGRYPERVEKLVTVATNSCFVARDRWPTAMAENTFTQFCDFFSRQPDACLKQFAGLQAKGDANERALLRELRSLLAEWIPEPDSIRHGRWMAALHLLGTLDNRDGLRQLAVPSLHLFGDNDSLVPVAAEPVIGAFGDHIQTRVFSACGHVPQLSIPDQFVAEVSGFINGKTGSDAEANPYAIDKARVAHSFSRAAATYDQVAHLQRQVGEQLLASIPDDLEPQLMVDVGAGTGIFTQQLHQRYPGAMTLGLDIAEGMLRFAQHHHPASGWLCCDAEALALADNSVDLLFSNFAVQWCQNLPLLMAEFSRVLKPGGALVFSTVGPRSLWELREAWQSVDGYAHVNHFTPVETVVQQVQGSGLVISHCRNEERRRFYPSLKMLTHELKALGAHNINSGRNHRVTPRGHIEQLKNAYERHRTDGGLPATWEVITMVARKPLGAN